MDQAVTPFRAFLDSVPGLSPGETQQRARRLLPERVGESSLGWWSPDRPIPASPAVLLVGVAVWSAYDLNLLDQLDEAVSHGTRATLAVYVFDVDAVDSEEGFEALLPGIGFVHHSPVVGHWVGGKLIEKACGFHARELVARLFGLDAKAMIERPAPAGA